jgi:hypothetical protein
MADISGAFEVDGLVRQKEALESLMMSNPAMEKKVQGLIRKVLMAARRTVANSAKDAMKSDPRKAYQAVKTAVYRQILGGNVSILNKRGTRFDSYEPPRTLQPGQRGGNRRKRTDRSNRLLHYAGSSRAFVLRFLNAGTQGRVIDFTSDPRRARVNRGSQGGNLQKYGKTVNTGRRGSIRPRNFFATSSHTAMMKAADQLTALIDDLIKKEMK